MKKGRIRRSIIACGVCISMSLFSTPSLAVAAQSGENVQEPETVPADPNAMSPDKDSEDILGQGAVNDEPMPSNPSGEDEQTGKSFEYSAITDEEIAEIVAEGNSVNDMGEALSLFAATSAPEVSLSGKNRYETAALQAKHGWADGSTYAIVTSGEGWADALSSAGLAGIFNCPILLTPYERLDAYTKEALVSLGVSKVIIVGGEGVISNQVALDLKGLGISSLERIGGKNRYETQLKIFERGMGQWSSGMVIVARAAGESDFADALASSPLAYKQKYPIFLTNLNGDFTEGQKSVLAAGAKSGLFQSSLILGGEACVSARSEGFLWAVSQVASGNSKASVRIAGKNRWDTSSQLASWAISRGYLTANNAAFSSGDLPYDSLGGGALQGRSGSVLLLVNNQHTDSAISTLKSSGGVTSIVFFGGTGVIFAETRHDIKDKLGLVDESPTSYKSYSITLEAMAQLEYLTYPADEKGNRRYSLEELQKALDASRHQFGEAEYYQFAVLSDGYSGKVTADQLNSFIDNMVVYQESSRGCRSKLRGAGQYIIDAAKKWNVNEVYLLAHAALESAWGCSSLAQGTVGGYEGFFNFYGIGAYDLDPNNGGAALAKREGWNTVEKALDGAAGWISKNYVNPTVSSAKDSGAQNTLYKMKWDLQRAVSQGDVWHQYATSITWPVGIANVMSNYYSFSGLSMADTGLRFEIPLYRG